MGSIPTIRTRKLQRRCWLHRLLIAYGAGSNPAGPLRRTVAQMEDAGKNNQYRDSQLFPDAGKENVPWQLTAGRGHSCKIRSDNRNIRVYAIGRRAGFRDRHTAGSIPAARTIWECSSTDKSFRLLIGRLQVRILSLPPESCSGDVGYIE